MMFPQAQLGDHVDVVGGFAFKSETFAEEGIPVIRISDIQEGAVSVDKAAKIPVLNIGKGARFTVEPGDILIAMSGATTGKIGLAPQNLTGCVLQNQRVGNFKIKHPEKILKVYLKHFVCSATYQNQVYNLMAGAAQPNISSSQLESITVPVPPLPEQRRIAAILDQADALRAKRREALAQLDSLTQSIFIEMFGDPVENPNGWQPVQLSDVSDIVTGFAFKSEEYVDGSSSSIKLCRGANVMPGRLDWSDLASWPASKIEQISAFQLQAGDIVMAMDRPWISEGFKVAQVSKNDCPSLLVQRVARLRGIGEVSNDYIYHLLNHPVFTAHCRPTETTIPHISPREIRSFRFHLPPVHLQRNFVNRVSCLNNLKSSQVESLKELDALFASLQHRAFQGEL
jgi:type I restriction enzyme S subunit